MKKKLRIILIIILICMFVVPSSVFATEENREKNTEAVARASYYIQAYGGFITANGGGNISISFTVLGTRQMDRIGATTILLYENNVLIKTYSYSQYSNMMGYNKLLQTGSLSYSGVAGRSYKAIIYYIAEDSTGYDTATKFTDPVTAN